MSQPNYFVYNEGIFTVACSLFWQKSGKPQRHFDWSFLYSVVHREILIASVGATSWIWVIWVRFWSNISVTLSANIFFPADIEFCPLPIWHSAGCLESFLSFVPSSNIVILCYSPHWSNGNHWHLERWRYVENGELFVCSNSSQRDIKWTHVNMLQ